MLRNRTRLMLIDDHTVMRQGLRAFLERREEFEIVAEASNGREALTLAKQHRPEVVIMDISMPGLNGLEAARGIKKINPNIKVIALSMHSNEHYVKGMFEAGAKGYVLKTCESDEVLRAIDAVRRGRTYITPEVTHVIVGWPDSRSIRQEGMGSPSPEVLTGKEREVLQLIAEGLSNKEVAAKLDMSVKTAETHRAHLMGKLNLHNVAGLTRYAIRHGIISLDG